MDVLKLHFHCVVSIIKMTFIRLQDEDTRYIPSSWSITNASSVI